MIREVDRLPKKGSGWMSLTVSEDVYSHYKGYFESKKEQLARKGITSFAGYITSMLEDLMERDEVFARYAPFIEEFGYDDDGKTIYLKDNKTGRIADVVFQNKELYCRLDERGDCVHVGFAYSLPKVYKVMLELGIKPPKMRR